MENLKKPIKPILRNLEKGQEEIYHRSQRQSVTSSRDQLQASNPKIRFILSKVDEDYFKVTRIK